PARFLLVAAMNPCPCGHWGDTGAECRCLPDAIERYRGRLSGPLLDRIDLRAHVPRVPYDELRDESRERSSLVRDRVLAARERMRQRQGRGVNADLGVAEVRRFCRIDRATDALLAEAVRARHLSVRGYHRVLRVSRTIAVLAAGVARYLTEARGRRRRLAHAIRGHGALVSEFPPEAPAQRWTFAQRDSTIAALGAVTAVVEAPVGSGALITAAEARKLGRPLYAIPGPIGAAASA